MNQANHVSPESGRRPSGRAPPCPSACAAGNGSLPVCGERSVAYPGPAGSHTASAAAALFPSARLVPLAGFRAVADAVTAMDAVHGVLPIESSLVGAGRGDARPALRARALDRRGDGAADPPLPRRPGAVRARGRSASCARTRRRSTSAATCSRACRRRRRSRSATTAEAAQQVGRGRRPDATWRSSRRRRSSLYGLTVLADDIGDHPAFTRFVSIAPLHAHRRPARTRRGRRSRS